MIDRFQTFTVLVAKMNRCIRKIKTEEMAEFDLKSPHVSCLYYLYGADSLTATELCEICEEDKALQDPEALQMPPGTDRQGQGDRETGQRKN